MEEKLRAIFKAYDIRGKVGSELTPGVLEVVGKAFAEFLPADGVVAVGYDMRPDSKQLADAVIKGLNSQGRDVWDIGQVTSDMIYFTVGHFGLSGGAMVTASHNPGEYNGVKMCREEAKPIGDDTGLKDIQSSAIANVFTAADNPGKTVTKTVDNAWIDHVLTFIDVSKLKPLKLAVDAGNGMAGKIFPLIQSKLPFEVKDLYFELDGTFPNHIANPMIPENLKDVIWEVKNNGLDAGLAFDGDGDRAVLVDENGDALSGTVMTAMLAEYLLAKNPGSTVLHNAICGNIVPEVIQATGGKAVRTRVGHSFIKDDMRKHDGLFAGEHSGHYYFRDNFMADSGLIAAVIGLAILSESNMKLSELAAKYRKYISIDETNFEVEDKQTKMKQVAAQFEGNEQDWLDGLTVRFEDGTWLNVRPSNTEPVLRLNAESSDQNKLDEVVNKVTQVINS